MDCTKLLSLCADSRFAKPRSFLKKVLIVAVRSCGCGVLIRGLENLEAPCKGDVFTFFLHNAKRINPFPFREAPRFFKPRNSAHKQQPRTNQIKSFFRLLETWSPCSRPFAILPVSAVSDAQKLAPGNFLHVRACFLVLFARRKKNVKTSLFRGIPRFSKPRISTPQ